MDTFFPAAYLLKALWTQWLLYNKGGELLSKMMIDKFVVLDDSAYDSVREMKSWLEKTKNKGRKEKIVIC